jgi:hypothetical protein
MDEHDNGVGLPEHGCTTSGSIDVPAAVASPEGTDRGCRKCFSPVLFGNDSNLTKRVRSIIGLRKTQTRVISWAKVDPEYYEWNCCCEPCIVALGRALGQCWKFLRGWPKVRRLALALVLLLCLPIVPFLVLFHVVHYLAHQNTHTVWVLCEMDLKVVTTNWWRYRIECVPIVNIRCRRHSRGIVVACTIDPKKPGCSVWGTEVATLYRTPKISYREISDPKIRK